MGGKKEIPFVKKDWNCFVREILRHASHGYIWYARVDIPDRKLPLASRIDRKIIQKFPEVLLSKDQRYRRRKKDKANYAYLRYGRWGIILRSSGELSSKDDEIWHSFKKKPYEFWIEEKCLEIEVFSFEIGPGGRGKHTCYLTKQCYREIKTLLRELYEAQKFDLLQKQWNALQRFLPGWSGLWAQAYELYRALKKWHIPARFALKRPELRNPLG